MAWKNSYEIELEYTDSTFRANFDEVYTFCRFFRNGLVSSDYSAPDCIMDAIKLTSEGEALRNILLEKLPYISIQNITFAIFIYFFHDDLFIDLTSTDISVLKSTLSEEIIAHKRHFPWVYDRVLYDKFFDTFDSQTEDLTFVQATQLISNTYPGVFQLDKYVIGPFGVLESEIKRLLPPVLSVKLWHCSDPSCLSLHTVYMSQADTDIRKAYKHIISIFKSPKSEWERLYLRNTVHRKEAYYDDNNTDSLPFLFGNAFSDNEIRLIFKTILTIYSKQVRERFPLEGRFKKIVSGSANDIAGRLNRSQIFQLLLLSSNDIIINAIEHLIDNNNIVIPPTETREQGLSMYRGGWLRIIWQCSRYGIRSVSSVKNIQFTRLKNLVIQLHDGEHELEELDWKLRHIVGNTISQKLDNYIYGEDPRNILENLVFSGKSNVKKSFDILKYGHFIMPTSPDQERQLIDKLLWKLGFQLNLYPKYQQSFWDRVEKLLSISNQYESDVYDESNKDEIRSAGVNFFVSVEELLEQSLIFMVWLMFSDHYLNTKLYYNYSDSRSYSTNILNKSRINIEKYRLEYDPNGRNTLYPLIIGFKILAITIEDYLLEGKIKYFRTKENLPGYADSQKLYKFPFESTLYLFDLDKISLENTIYFLKEVTQVMETINICDIRNRIDHKREDFPSKTEINMACNAVKKIVLKMEELGICPTIFNISNYSGDSYGRARRNYSDYKGKTVSVDLPSRFREPLLPERNNNIIIVRSLLIGDSMEIVKFGFEEESEYTMLWKNYPRRKPRLTRVDSDITSQEET